MARITVRLTPRASCDEIVGIRVTAPPVDGGANEGLVRLLAKALGVPRMSISIVAGTASRTKIIDVAGVDAALLQRVLSDLTGTLRE